MNREFSNNIPTEKSENGKTSLIVNYLPPDMTEADLKSLFSRIGLLHSVKLIRDKVHGNSLGYSFVNFVNGQDAEKAIKTFDGLKLFNKTIKVSYARPCSEEIKDANVYVSGLPKSLTQDDLEDMFKSYGNIISSYVLNNRIKDLTSGESKGIGFVRYDKRAEAEKAVKEMNGTMPLGFTAPIIVKIANRPGAKRKDDSEYYMPRMMPSEFLDQMDYPLGHSSSGKTMMPLNKGLQRYSPMNTDTGHSMMSSNKFNKEGNWSLFVFNLNPDTEESALWRLFGPFGAVQNVKVIKDKDSNKGRGFAFVTMTNYDDALIAIQTLNGSTLENRAIQVSFKTDKRKYSQIIKSV